MKNHLLTLGLACFAFTGTQAQVTMSKTLPPFGATFEMSKVTSGVTKASMGADQVWDYSAATTSPMFQYSIIDPGTTNQTIQDSFPTADYIEMLNLGAPDINVNPMDFYEDKGTFLGIIGQKNSGSSISRKNDTAIVFDQTYGSTLVYAGKYTKYAGYGTLKVQTKTYDSVVMIVFTQVSSPTDTVVGFYQFKPYYQRLMIYAVISDTIAAAYYYEPSTTTPTGLKSITANSFTVYPNPASDGLNIAMDKVHENVRAQITDLQGRVVLSTQVERTDRIRLDVGAVPKGFYLISIESKEGISYQRISIQ